MLWLAFLLSAAGLAAMIATTAGAGALARWQRAALALLVPTATGAVLLLVLRQWFAPIGRASRASDRWRQGRAAFFVFLCLAATLVLFGILRLLVGL